MSKKQPTSMRFSPEAIRLLKKLAKKLGVSHTAIVEMSVRWLAEVEKIK